MVDTLLVVGQSDALGESIGEQGQPDPPEGIHVDLVLLRGGSSLVAARDVLLKYFGCDPSKARLIIGTAIQNGRVGLGRFSPAEAMTVLSLARAHARANKEPLDIRWQEEPGPRILTFDELEEALIATLAREVREFDPSGFKNEEFLLKNWGLPTINLAEFEIEPEVIKLMPAELARRLKVLPINRMGRTLIVAFDAAPDKDSLDAIAQATNYNVAPVIGDRTEIVRLIAELLG